MVKGTDAATKASLEAAVRSFTQSEVALGEFVIAAQRFRSAAESLAESQVGLERLHAPVLESVDIQRTMAAELQALAQSLGTAAAVVSSLDPERFWSSFSSLETVMTRMVDDHSRGLEEQARQLAETRRVASHARAIALIVLLVSVITLGIVTQVFIALL